MGRQLTNHGPQGVKYSHENRATMFVPHHHASWMENMVTVITSQKPPFMQPVTFSKGDSSPEQKECSRLQFSEKRGGDPIHENPTNYVNSRKAEDWERTEIPVLFLRH